MTSLDNVNGSSPRVMANVVDVVVLMPVASAPPGEWHVLALRRAPGVRCTGAWEIVHGRIEHNELPADAACRELFEETGLSVVRLYTLAVNPFYVHGTNVMHMAIGFVAIVAPGSQPQLSHEHDSSAWLLADDAVARLAWPRSHDAIRHATHLLRTGDAGAVEDVLRVR